MNVFFWGINAMEMLKIAIFNTVVPSYGLRTLGIEVFIAQIWRLLKSMYLFEIFQSCPRSSFLFDFEIHLCNYYQRLKCNLHNIRAIWVIFFKKISST